MVMSSKEKHQPKRQRVVTKTTTTTTTTKQADSLLEDVSQKSEEETTITTTTANMTSTEETDGGGGGGYSSSEEMDDELKMLDSREFSPIKPNDVDDGGQQQEPHATMYSSAVSHTQEMFATAGGKTTTTNFISPHTDADALESDGELLDLEHDLPETVTVLKTKDNSHTIYLIGTSHFSKQSHRDVRRVSVG